MSGYVRIHSELGSVSGRQKVWTRRSRSVDNWQGLKSLGLLVTVATIFGCAASLWFGWQIRIGLDALAHDKEISRELSAINGKMMDSKEKLMLKERIEAEAAAIGLFLPSAKQIRRP